MKNFLLSLLFFVFAFGTIKTKANTWYDQRNPNWGLDYEATDRFLICSSSDLAQWAWLVNKQNKNFQGKTVELELANGDHELHMSAYVWDPVGVNENRFMGHFDGKGHTISGIWIATTTDYTGFFSSIGSTGKVRNLHIEIADSGIKGGNRVGGFAGACYGEISNCSVIGGEITGLGFSIGGLVGSAYAGSVIRNCNVQCTLKATDVYKLHIGGLVGYLDGGIVQHSQANSIIVVTNAETSDIGGFIGYQKAGTISNCFTKGVIHVENAEDTTVGGFVGKQCDTITESHCDTEITTCRVKNSFIGSHSGKTLH